MCDLLKRQLTVENLNILNSQFESLKPSVKYIRKLCKYFTTVEYPAGTNIYMENEQLDSCFIVKEGICEKISYKTPLRYGEKFNS